MVVLCQQLKQRITTVWVVPDLWNTMAPWETPIWMEGWTWYKSRTWRGWHFYLPCAIRLLQYWTYPMIYFQRSPNSEVVRWHQAMDLQVSDDASGVSKFMSVLYTHILLAMQWVSSFLASEARIPPKNTNGHIVLNINKWAITQSFALNSLIPIQKRRALSILNYGVWR